MKDRKPTVKGTERREHILAHALTLFNTRGVEHVGIREVARSLGMRPGHVTYYFPEKESLVMALGERMGTEMGTAVPDATVGSVEEFLERFRAVMRVHVRYRGLVLYLGPLLRDMPAIRRNYRARQQHRRESLRQAFKSLVDKGYLHPLSPEEEGHLVSLCSLVARGWVPESLASGHALTPRIPHYLGMLAMAMDGFRPDARVHGKSRRIG